MSNLFLITSDCIFSESPNFKWGLTHFQLNGEKCLSGLVKISFVAIEFIAHSKILNKWDIAFELEKENSQCYSIVSPIYATFPFQICINSKIPIPWISVAEISVSCPLAISCSKIAQKWIAVFLHGHMQSYVRFHWFRVTCRWCPENNGSTQNKDYPWQKVVNAAIRGWDISHLTHSCHISYVIFVPKYQWWHIFLQLPNLIFCKSVKCMLTTEDKKCIHFKSVKYFCIA